MQTYQLILTLYKLVKVIRNLPEDFFFNFPDDDYYPIAMWPNITKQMYLPSTSWANHCDETIISAWLYLCEKDVDKIVHMDLPSISRRLASLEDLNFCLHYFNALKSLRQMNDLRMYEGILNARSRFYMQYNTVNSVLW